LTGQKQSKHKSGSKDTSEAPVPGFSTKNNLNGEDAHEVITAESYMSTWLNRARTLCQPGYSAEKKPGIVLLLFYQS